MDLDRYWFVCPSCGGHYWGTAITDEGRKWTGHCHDQYGQRCPFTWDRDDDEKYFEERSDLTLINN